MNFKKWIYLGIALVFISLAGNYYVFSSNKLPAPVFAKHYYELEVYEGRQANLHYFTNRNDTADVMGVSIPETDIMLSAMTHDMGLEGTYLHKVMTVELDERVLKEVSTIHQLEVHFSDGKRMLADIGEINFFPYKESPLDGQSAGASSDNAGYTLFQTNEDVEITGVDVPFRKQIGDGLKLGISNDQQELSKFDGPDGFDGVPDGKEVDAGLFPFSRKKGELVSISHQFQFEEDDENRLHFYEIEAKLLGKTGDGKDFWQPFHVSYQPELDDRTVKAIIKGESK